MVTSSRTFCYISWMIVVSQVGCSGTGDMQPRPAVTWHQDIKPIFDAYCNDCHRVDGIGPFALDTLDSVRIMAKLIPSSVSSRRMPPFLAAPARRPLKFDQSLSDTQIEKINTWIEIGLPAGDSDTPGAAIEIRRSTLSRVDRIIGMETPYAPKTAPDEYRCFVLDWPEKTTKYITGFNIIPGQLKLAHHAALFIISAASAGVVDEADGGDGQGVGYPCFGSAAPPGHAGLPNKLLAAWTPGGGGLDFPVGTGIRIEPGDRVILQMHYAVNQPGFELDQTRVELSLEDSVPINAGNLPWLDVEWPTNPDSMLIKAGADAVRFEHVADPTESPLLGEFAPGVNPVDGLKLYGLLPHMHKLGKRFWLQLERQDGGVERFFEIGDWDFDWQGYYLFEEPVIMRPGDALRMHCEFDNRAENQPLVDGKPRSPMDVIWGEGSDDEMCTVSMYVHGLATADGGCDESVKAPEGRFEVTFDTSDGLRVDDGLDGEFIGPVFGRIYRASDVSLLGPSEGATPVATFELDEVDLRTGPSEPFIVDTPLPAGEYQFLGYMDTDGNRDDTGGPDLNDPIMIPSRPAVMECAVQSVTIQFPMLLPDL
ncbi:MAG: hypothetical protein VX589_16770 [Myxococcota bacterium]|nr:hypothetical protein [Myxococcota bacterium]